MIVFPSITHSLILGTFALGVVIYIMAATFDIGSSNVSPPEVRLTEILLAMISAVSNPCKVLWIPFLCASSVILYVIRSILVSSFLIYYRECGQRISTHTIHAIAYLLTFLQGLPLQEFQVCLIRQCYLCRSCK